MIAGEQYFIAIVKNLMSARMSGCGDELKITVDTHRRCSRDDALDAASGGALRFMHDARATEMRGEFGVVRNVIAVRKKHEIHTAHFFDTPDQGIVETR